MFGQTFLFFVLMFGSRMFFPFRFKSSKPLPFSEVRSRYLSGLKDGAGSFLFVEGFSASWPTTPRLFGKGCGGRIPFFSFLRSDWRSSSSSSLYRSNDFSFSFSRLSRITLPADLSRLFGLFSPFCSKCWFIRIFSLFSATMFLKF